MTYSLEKIITIADICLDIEQSRVSFCRDNQPDAMNAGLINLNLSDARRNFINNISAYAEQQKTTNPEYKLFDVLHALNATLATMPLTKRFFDNILCADKKMNHFIDTSSVRGYSKS